MLSIDWDEYLVTGVEEIDEQHRRFVEAINRLYTVIVTEGSPGIRAAVSRALADLEDYTLRHFLTEEEFMERIGFPGLRDHRALHRDFSARIAKYRGDFTEGGLVLSSDLIKEMLRWFRNHLSEEDRRYVEFRAGLAAS